ncbi:Uncharacterized protein BM_BM17547 [Brugia malayi]|uniref:C2H2-type domain-containing protein n=1 Tax=Brugia malayi TaxID=6279 RepID=A0A4E9FJ00_BRUMA|nr:Uncharacterized protein BM_BM17547 [Brugia malayi]VIO94820.1 Uncharacterized protein BM_BM17547 [Brugia malayi]
MTPIIWLNLLLCIASDNETSHLPNLDSSSGISDGLDILDYNNFEPLSSSEFPSDPSQFIDFAQLSETEDISNEEWKSETNQIVNDPHPGFSDIYDPFGHTNLELSLNSDMDSYRNLWRDANEELKTGDDNVRYASISDDTSNQSAIAEQSNIDNKHFSDNLNILDYRGNAYKGAKTDKKNYTCHYPGCTVTMKNYKEYVTHRKTHGQPFIYECKVPGCGRTFDYDSSFRNHKQTHEPHPQCGYCGQFFTTKNGLNYHKKSCQIKSR